MSISLNVVKLAAAFCDAFKFSAIRNRIRVIFTRFSVRLKAAADGAVVEVEVEEDNFGDDDEVAGLLDVDGVDFTADGEEEEEEGGGGGDVVLVSGSGAFDAAGSGFLASSTAFLEDVDAASAPTPVSNSAKS